MKVAPIAMALHTGPHMTIEFANNLMLNAWGKDDSIMGKSFAEALPELEKFDFQKEMNEVLRTGIPFSAEQIQMQYLHNNTPKTFYYSYGFTPIKSTDGTIWGILNFAHDVTEQVIGREAMQRLKEKENLLQREQTLNEELLQTQQNLQQLNVELESRVARRTQELTLSENRFRLVIEQAPVAIIVFRGTEMIIDAVNPPMLHLLDKKADILGQPLLTAIPELAGQGPYELLHKIYHTGQPVYGFDTPVVLNRLDKEEIGYYNFSYTPLVENGKITGIIDMAVEVTDQVKARQSVQNLNNELLAINTQLSESEANLRLTIEAANIGVWHYDIATGKFHMDQRCRQLYGLPLEGEVTVNDIQLPADAEYLPLLQTTLKNAIENNEPCDIQYPITHPATSEHKWLRVIGKINKKDDGTSRFYGVTMDITEQKKDEERKNDFIGMVSHELKTPLTSLSGYVQVLQLRAKNNIGDTFTGPTLDKAYHQIKRMSTLINGFLNVSRLESGKIHLDKTDFSLSELVQEMIEEAAVIQPRHSLSFSTFDTLLVHADRDKIGSVVSNLLSNAIKYSPNHRNIEVRCEQVNGVAQVQVRDEGIGIAEKDIHKLFERYYRVKGDSSISGFGIGLYLSAEIIQRHHGKIWVESQPGKGSTFFFTLPLK